MNNQTIRVRNPATLESVGELPIASAADVAAATPRARGKPRLSGRRKVSRREPKLLRRFRDLLIDEQDRLADIVTSETGKPRADVFGNELFYVCDAIGFWTKSCG